MNVSIKMNGQQLFSEANEHTCKPTKQRNLGPILELEGEMKQVVEKLAVSELKLSAAEISAQVLHEFEDKYKDRMFKGLNIEQMKSMVYRARKSEFADWAARIESFPLAHTSSVDERFFLQFHSVVNVDGELHRIIRWGHPDIIFHLKGGKVRGFVDGTFRVVPKGFYQLFMLMVYLEAFDLYVPAFYILLTGKLQKLYEAALEAAKYATDNRLSLSTITQDFEQAIINAGSKKFPEASPIVCLFHPEAQTS